MKRKLTSKEGISTIRVFLTIIVICLSVFAVLLYIHQKEYRGHARNSERWRDINEILTAVHEYQFDHNGLFPESITTTQKEICKQTASECENLTDLSILLEDFKYLPEIPEDPLAQTESNGTGYVIARTKSGRLIIFAKLAEGGEDIYVIL